MDIRRHFQPVQRLQASFYIFSREDPERRVDGPRLGTEREPFDGTVMDGLDAADHFQATNGLLTGSTLGSSQREHDATTYALYRKPACLRAGGRSDTQACTE